MIFEDEYDELFECKGCAGLFEEWELNRDDLCIDCEDYYNEEGD